MSNEIRMILEDLRMVKITVSAVEKELGFSNGLLGKAAKGATKLSAERMAALVKYHQKNAPKPERPTIAEPMIKEPEKVPSEDPRDASINNPIIPKGIFIKLAPKEDEFQGMLNEFKRIIAGMPPVEKVKEKLLELKKYSNIARGCTVWQRSAIADRCDNYIKGEYGNTKKDSNFGHMKIKP